jgi:Kef-type K+ transport system membrane component KefB
MEANKILLDIFLIFGGAAVLSTMVLLSRQSLLVAYMLLGILFGPWGLKLVPHLNLAKDIGDIGIIFLLFLLGLELDPRDLWKMLSKVSFISIVSSIVFFTIGAVVPLFFGFNIEECAIIGIAMMFSSTIIGLKLLPVSTLHNHRIGEVMISILLLQDLIAIFVMLFFHGMSTPSPYWVDFGVAMVTLPALLLIGFIGERFLLRPLLSRFHGVEEYIFLVAIAWCLGLAKLAAQFGLSYEIGAFIAGVAIAEGPIAHSIAHRLGPIRDFCLVMFFFAIGAQFDLQTLGSIWMPAVILAVLMVIIKPFLFRFLLKKSGESGIVADEAGVRLGQGSEFSILLGAMAYGLVPTEISAKTSYLIQATTMITFVVSCYWVVIKYPTPMAFSKDLKKN